MTREAGAQAVYAATLDRHPSPSTRSIHKTRAEVPEHLLVWPGIKTQHKTKNHPKKKNLVLPLKPRGRNDQWLSLGFPFPSRVFGVPRLRGCPVRQFGMLCNPQSPEKLPQKRCCWLEMAFRKPRWKRQGRAGLWAGRKKQPEFCCH